MDDTSNIYLRMLNLQGEVGALATSILVNAHKFNSIDPEDIDFQINQIKKSLDQLSSRYKEEHRKTTFEMVH